MTTILSWPADPGVALVVGPEVAQASLAQLDHDLAGTVELVVLGEEPPQDDVVAALVAALRRAPDATAAGHLEPLVDAVKQVGADGGVEASLDRSLLGHPGLPLAVRRGLIAGHAGGLDDLEIDRMVLV